METKTNIEELDTLVAARSFNENSSPVMHVSRGDILSDVLDGLASYDSMAVVTDLTPAQGDAPIDYDPNSDQRLDKFDAVELGFDAMDRALPDPVTGKTSDPEKKE